MKKLSMTIVALSVLLGGCASMSGDECVTSDWHAVGFEDGSRGYGADRIGTYRKSCAKHGVTPDLQAYQEGRDEGLSHYCQPSRGFSVGSNGGSYNGVCAAHGEPEFVDAYNTGYHLYNLRSRVNSATSQIKHKQSVLEKNEELMRNKEAALISKDTLVEDRVMILADLKKLSEENGQLEAEIVQLIEERAYHEQSLAAYEASLADSGF